MFTFGFRSRVLFFVVALVGAVVLTTVSGVAWFSRLHVNKQAEEQIAVAAELVRAQLEVRRRSLSEAVQVLARDFGFREVVATADHSTILSAAINLASRLGTNRLIVIDADGRLLADTQPDVGDTQAPEWAPFDAARAGATSYSHAAMTSSGAYILSSAPILAPDLIGQVIIALHIDDKLIAELATSLPNTLGLSFIYNRSGTSSRLVATTMQHHGSDAAIAFSPVLADPLNEHRVQIGESDYLVSFVDSWSGADGSALTALLHISVAEAMQPWTRLSWSIIGIALIALGISVIGSILLARSVAGPVQELSAAAERIALGDYSQRVVGRRSDELGRLAESFNKMVDDIQDREKLIREQSQYDGATGLPNGRYMEARIEECLKLRPEDADSLVVFVIAIHRFDEISATLGHELSDRVVEMVAERLGNNVRDADTIARLASEKLAVLLPMFPSSELSQRARHIVAVFEEPLLVGDTPVDIGVHIGMACFPEHAKDGATLLRQANSCLYFARKQSSRYAAYDVELDQLSKERLGMMGELRQAIAEDRLELHYQPQVSLADGRVKSVEALVRWPKADGSFIGPLDFIPLAEYTGDIQRLTEWVLEKGIAWLAEQRRNNIDIGISINLSAKDLLNRHLPTLAAELASRYGVEPSMICLEMTESAVMNDRERVVDVMNALVRQGFELAVDDFGTGYSSLAYLKQLPVNELKIDQTFIRDMCSDTQSDAIVRTTIRFAKDLGLRVVAEGVEHDEERKRLCEYGCDVAQGYLFARPLPASEISQWIKHNHTENHRDASGAGIVRFPGRRDV